MRYLLWVIFYGFIYCNAGFAQTTYDSLSVKKPVHQFSLKLNPFALLELDGGIGLSAEYVWTKYKIGLQLEVQPIFLSYDNIIVSGDGTPGFEAPENTITSAMPTGMEWRPEVRYYFTATKGLYKTFDKLIKDIIPFRKKKTPLQTYAAIDFLYKYTRRERLGDLPVSNGGIGTSYRQRTIYTDVKKVLGFDFKAGAKSPIRNSERWWVEAYIGIGYRWKTYSYKNIPPGIGEPARNLFLVTEPTVTSKENLGLKVNGISLPATLKLIYQL